MTPTITDRRLLSLLTATGLALAFLSGCGPGHSASPAARAKALSESIDGRPECAQYRSQLTAPGLNDAAIDAIYFAAKSCIKRDG
jgi:hypothetical protein